MKLYDIKGRLVNKSVTKYRIRWDGECRSNFQYEVKQFFKKFWYGQICYEEFPVYGSRMKVDFINATKKIAVEVNGQQHDEFNKFFHSNSRTKYLQSIQRDAEKHQWLELNNFIIIEIYEKDLQKLSLSYIKDVYGISIV